MLELHLHLVGPLRQADDLVAKQDFRLALDCREQEPGKVGARQRYVSAAGQLAEHARPEPCYALAPPVHNPHLAHVVADALKLVRKPHPLGDVVAEAPKIDDIAAFAQARLLLNERRCEPCGVEPEGERRPGDPGA
jgi:hypothetical protein